MWSNEKQTQRIYTHSSAVNTKSEGEFERKTESKDMKNHIHTIMFFLSLSHSLTQSLFIRFSCLHKFYIIFFQADVYTFNGSLSLTRNLITKYCVCVFFIQNHRLSWIRRKIKLFTFFLIKFFILCTRVHIFNLFSFSTYYTTTSSFFSSCALLREHAIIKLKECWHRRWFF